MAKVAKASAHSGTGAAALSLKVTLRGTRPPIWRRLLMPETATLRHLHLAIQAAMGWEDDHLHDFRIDGQRYGDRSTADDVADEARVSLGSLVKSGVARFDYTYDFGDDWQHLVVIEKRPPGAEMIATPRCVAGKRNCPPEDCGGVPGYERMLAIVADPAHPEHNEQREWLGEEFDPEDFSVDIADAALAARFGRR